MRRRRARCSADANGAGAGSRSREPDDIFTPPAFRPSNFLMQPVVRYPTTDKVAIENDGDIELNTGTVASAKVLTTADIFVDGSTEGLLAQLTSVTSRLAAVETQLARLLESYPLDATLVAGVSVTEECYRSSSNRQTYGCSRDSMWPVIAKAGSNDDAWGCEDGSKRHDLDYGHMASRVCECADGWKTQAIRKIPNDYGDTIVCVKIPPTV